MAKRKKTKPKPRAKPQADAGYAVVVVGGALPRRHWYADADGRRYRAAGPRITDPDGRRTATVFATAEEAATAARMDALRSQLAEAVGGVPLYEEPVGFGIWNDERLRAIKTRSVEAVSAWTVPAGVHRVLHAESREGDVAMVVRVARGGDGVLRPVEPDGSPSEADERIGEIRAALAAERAGAVADQRP